jgi:hypothetical protein
MSANEVVSLEGIEATPGPWRWEVNPGSHGIELCGGKPMYDMTVMDFVRWGMRHAQPRFVVGGLLYKAEQFMHVAPQRAHHKEWFQLLNHPDANLIAAAPCLLKAAERLLAELHARIDCAPKDAVPVFIGIAALSDAINKARGRNIPALLESPK